MRVFEVQLASCPRLLSLVPPRRPGQKGHVKEAQSDRAAVQLAPAPAQMGSLNLSPPASDLEIPRLVADSFADSIDKQYIHLYAASSDRPFRVTDDPPQFPQVGHVVHQLRDKPAVPPTTPDLSKRREKDVLQGPEYGKGEKILRLEQGGVTYSLVHNLHALCQSLFSSPRPSMHSFTDAYPPTSSGAHDGDPVLWRRGPLPASDE